MRRTTNETIEGATKKVATENRNPKLLIVQ